jgi:two-component system nitrogen regulation response regulator NtrX
MSLIACVEDDEKIAANLVLRLREAGHGVVRFASGEEAERWLRGSNPEVDMLLVDVRLPGMSGINLLNRLGADRPPVVIISGEASMAETVEAMRLGVHDFLDKPISRERLLKIVQNCLDHAALRRQVDALRANEQRILGVTEPVRTHMAAIRKVAET